MPTLAIVTSFNDRQLQVEYDDGKSQMNVNMGSTGDTIRNDDLRTLSKLN